MFSIHRETLKSSSPRSPEKNEKPTSKKDTESPKPPSCVTIAVDTVSQPQVIGTPSEPGASRKRTVPDVDVDTVSDQSGEDAKRKIGRQKKKRRVRLFLEPDEESTTVIDKKAISTHSKGSIPGDGTNNASVLKSKTTAALESETGKLGNDCWCLRLSTESIGFAFAKNCHQNCENLEDYRVIFFTASLLGGLIISKGLFFC